MAGLCITNATLLRPGVGFGGESLLVEEGRIKAIDPAPDQIDNRCERIDAGGALLTPGLIDVHTHGVHEFCYERDPKELLAGAACVAQYGTTCLLPTIYNLHDRSVLGRLAGLAEVLDDVEGAPIPGFHLEGPFLAIAGAGAATARGDVGWLEELLAAARGRVAAMSVSPDCPNVLPVIERLVEQGISVFLTHTRASIDQTQTAIDLGARHATHFFNVFPAPEEREPGVRPVGAVETILADSRCTVDLICDGVHVHPTAIRLALAAKGWQGLVAITDSNVGAGLPDGVYDTPWGYPVHVSHHDAARVHDPGHSLHGQLAGSSLTMDRAIGKLIDWLDLPTHEVWAMGTSNPARVAGLTCKGRLEVGADADLVLWGPPSHPGGPLRALQTWVGGRSVFNRDASTVTVPAL